jgi:hypothetical protein
MFPWLLLPCCSPCGSCSRGGFSVASAAAPTPAAVAAAPTSAASAVTAHALDYMAPVIMGESPLDALPVAANPVAAAPSATAHATAAHAAVDFMGAAPMAAVHFFTHFRFRSRTTSS